MNTKIVLPVLFFFLSFYCFGAGLMDSFVIYQGWTLVGAEEFAALHQANGQRIIQFYVLPTLLLTIITVTMFWQRPATIPKAWVGAAFIFQLIIWISSVLIQIPIQFKLDEGKDPALLVKLLATDWIRIIAWFIYIGIVSRLFFRLMTRSISENN